MSKDEFLVLRKTLTEYLNNFFIRISNSPVATPVFFLVKKPDGSLRFHIDYRNFNHVTKNNSLPLIYEIFRNIGKTTVGTIKQKNDHFLRFWFSRLLLVIVR